MHEQRRMVVCCLLAIHVDPLDPEWTVWRGVVREINGLVRILGDFTRELQRTLEDEQGTPRPYPLSFASRGPFCFHPFERVSIPLSQSFPVGMLY